jgi:hypothetical protein
MDLVIHLLELVNVLKVIQEVYVNLPLPQLHQVELVPQMNVMYNILHGLEMESVIKIILDITLLSVIGMVGIVDHHLSHQNVMLSFLLGLVMVFVIKVYQDIILLNVIGMEEIVDLPHR